jgi:hypothetical protein
MTKRFLNVQYGTLTAEVDITGMSRLGEVRRAIKAELSNSLAQVDAPLIQLYTTNRDQQINTWALLNSLPPEYFIEGGSCVVIGTSPPPSGQPRENSNTLSSVDASQLTVYKDRLLQVALEEDSLVSGLGSSKKDAIFVRIPIMHTPGL